MNYEEAFNSPDILSIDEVGNQFERVSLEAMTALNAQYVPFDEMDDLDVEEQDIFEWRMDN